MLKQIYSFGGLDLRSSDVNRQENRASDLQNVELDNQRQLKKRRGYLQDIDMLGVPVVDLIEYRSTRSLLIMSPTGLRRKDGASFKSVTFGGSLPSFGWTEGIDHAEYSNTLYFTDVAGKTNLFKYDGYMQYRAGIPQASATQANPASDRHYRIMYYHIDLQGNITWGDYVQFDNIVNLASFSVDTLKDTEFHNKFGNSDNAQAINAGNLTLTTNNHNYIAGDFIRALDANNEFKVLEIASVVANTSITFTAASVGADTFNYGAAEPVERRTYIVVAQSLNATFGYEITDYFLMDQSVAIQNVVTTAVNVPSVPLNDIYDTGIVRQLPPLCRYITVYGGTTLVLGNLADTKNFQSDPTKTGPQQESTIFWSSVFSEFGTSVENFLPFYREIVGTSYEGPVNGLFGASDSLTILKENQVYYFNGILQELQYRPRSALSARIGCVSHRSIVEAEGGCLFMSEKGVYLAKYGQKPVELSDLIEPLFTNDSTGLDLSRSRSAIDFISEKILWFIPATLPKDNLVLVFDYYYGEWFKHKGINADSGLVIVDDTELYHSDSSKVYVRQDAFNDDGVAIDAFYSSHWHHLGVPSLRKKFTNFILSSISSLIWDCNIKTQEDWAESDRTDIEIEMDGVKKIDDRRLNITQCKSLRFIIGNKVKNQGLLLTGYEFEYEGTQDSPKGES